MKVQVDLKILNMEKRIAIKLDKNQKKIDLLNLHLAKRNFETLDRNQNFSVLYINSRTHYYTNDLNYALGTAKMRYYSKFETIYFDSLGEFLVNINKYIEKWMKCV